MEQALIDYWRAIKSTVPHSDGVGYTGIFKFWAGLEGFEAHWRELGSVVNIERQDRTDNTVYQAFANGIVRWAPDGPSIV